MNPLVKTGARLVCSTLLTASLSLAAYAGQPTVMTAAEARGEIRQRLEALQNYQADFVQTVSDANGEVVDRSAGRFSLSRPNRFRWEYLEPFPRLIVSDGEHIWLYDEDLEQVTVRPFTGTIEHTPAALLAGRLDLLQDYEVTGERGDGVVLIELAPRNIQSDFRSIEIEFVAGRLAEMRLRDSFEQLTRVEFSALSTAPVTDPEVFGFTVPPGVDVIDESAGQG